MGERYAHMRLCEALESVEDVFAPGAVRLGLIAVHRSNPDAHMFVSNMSWEDAVRALAETARSNGIDPVDTLRAIASEVSRG